MPIPWVDPERRSPARPASQASKVAATIGFALLSLLAAFGVLTYIATLAGSTYDELGGGVGIAFLTIVLAGLLVGWLASLRAMRRRLRPPGVHWQSSQTEQVRRGRGRISTLLRLTFGRRAPGRRPKFQHSPKAPAGRAPGISAPRTDLRPSDITAVKRLSTIERTSTTRRGPVQPIAKLTGIEQSIGDVLYQLDLARDRHELTRPQIAELRLAGLRTSAWLSGHDHRVDPLGHPLLSDQQVAEGIARYDALARAAGEVLAGRTEASAVLGACERLRALLDPALPQWRADGQAR